MKSRSALVVFILLATTSAHTASALTSSTVGTTCSATVTKKVLGTITGQSEALAKRDFINAIAYASAKFRAKISVKDFIQIINESYNFLGNNVSFQIIGCQQMGHFIHLGVRVTDASNVAYYLVYVLQPQSKREAIVPNKTGYGIVAVQLSEIRSQVSYLLESSKMAITTLEF